MAEAKKVRRFVTPLGDTVSYATDHIILKDLRGQAERGRFAEAAFFASKLRAEAAALERYMLGEGGGPDHMYAAQRYLDRLMSALEFCLGARSARNHDKDRARTAKPKKRKVAA